MNTFSKCMGKVPSNLYVFLGYNAIGSTTLEQHTHAIITTFELGGITQLSIPLGDICVCLNDRAV